MGEAAGQIDWYRPHKRAIIPLGKFKVSSSLRKSARRFEYVLDVDFKSVINACADREETWISAEIEAAYVRLFEIGMAHSCATYRGEKLVGGVYAASFGAAMFGESMFHYETDAGKVALWKLIESAEASGYELFEVQFLTPHLQSLGAIEIDNSDYFPLLSRALKGKPKPLTL